MKHSMKRFVFGICLIISVSAMADDAIGLYPTHWWVNMKNPKLSSPFSQNLVTKPDSLKVSISLIKKKLSPLLVD